MQALIIKEDEWVKRKDVVMVMFDVLGKTDKVMTLDIFKELSDRLDEIGGVHFIPKEGKVKKIEKRYCLRCTDELTEENNKNGKELCDSCYERYKRINDSLFNKVTAKEGEEWLKTLETGL